MPRRALACFALLGLFVCGGASCQQMADQAVMQPAALPETPTLADVMAAVNGNSQKVKTLTASDMSVQAPLAPPLKANFAYERGRRMRLVAETALTGPEVDVGSNDERFWVWVRRSDPPALYFCRHADFGRSPMASRLPIQPDWLIEALGVAELDPTGEHHGPYVRPGERVEVHSVLRGERGPVTKVTVLDRRRGWILEQHWYDAQRQLLASALLSKHRYDPLAEVVLPGEIELKGPANANFSLRLAVSQWSVNLPGSTGEQRWQMPKYAGWNPVDLGVPAQPGPGMYDGPGGPQVLPTAQPLGPQRLPGIEPSAAYPQPRY